MERLAKGDDVGGGHASYRPLIGFTLLQLLLHCVMDGTRFLFAAHPEIIIPCQFCQRESNIWVQLGCPSSTSGADSPITPWPGAFGPSLM